MVTGELKNRIDGLWDIFFSGGLTNPLDVIEQMTYLMFIHDLDESDNLRAKEAAMLGLPHESVFADEVRIGERAVPGNQLKWSTFHDFPAALSVNDNWPLSSICFLYIPIQISDYFVECDISLNMGSHESHPAFRKAPCMSLMLIN